MIIFLCRFEPPARGRLVGKFHGKARAIGAGFFRLDSSQPNAELEPCQYLAQQTILISLKIDNNYGNLGC
jgi:hypothetical protein